jgi:hypothetical protein
MMVAAGRPVLPDNIVSVTKAPAQIERREFDPNNPPAEMPKLTPPEAGLCWYAFHCETELQSTTVTEAGKSVVTTVKSVKFRLRLKVMVWTRVNATSKLVAHEEAHREIAEIYYRDADAFARDLAEKLIGRRFSLPLTGTVAAGQAIIRKLQDNLSGDFIRGVADRCHFAEDRFDAITRHGLNPITEAEALARATAEERMR